MPMYEYKCSECDTQFEELVSISQKDNPPCPACGCVQTEKKISSFASLGGGSSCGTGGFT